MNALQTLLLATCLSTSMHMDAQGAGPATCQAFLVGTVNGMVVMTDAREVDIHAMNRDIITLWTDQIPEELTPAHWEVVRSNDAARVSGQQEALVRKYEQMGMQVQRVRSK
ncbi:MAG: hypothetical protein H6597_08090 [Flavobacteriales bacterium]|nr:hypothetical protein [Flavobacteriales bacterium]MCB9194474.1 hypothetical protein [Flavobacteriales bacterium]